MPDTATLTRDLRLLVQHAKGRYRTAEIAQEALDLIDQLTTDLDTVNEDERVYIERLEAQAKEHKARIAELEGSVQYWTGEAAGYAARIAELEAALRNARLIFHIIHLNDLAPIAVREQAGIGHEMCHRALSSDAPKGEADA